MTTVDYAIAAEIRAEQEARLARADRRRVLRARVARRWPTGFQVLGVAGLVSAAGFAFGVIALLAAASAAMLVTGALREAGII